MQQMVSRYRDRLMNSSSQIKALSASRQKSITTQSNNNNQNHIKSSQSLKKSRNRLDVSGNKIQNINQVESKVQLTNQRKTQQLATNNNTHLKNILTNTQFSPLPPQPIHMSSSAKQIKQKQKNINTHESMNPLKSSRRTNQKQTTNNKQKQQQNKQQKSKSKKITSRTPKKQVIITQFTVTQSFSQSLYDIFIQNIKQKSAFTNLIPLLNKQEIKQKIRLLLDEYFSKRTQISDKQKFHINMSESHINQNHNQQSAFRNMTQSYAVLNQQTYSNTVLQPPVNSTYIIPSTNTKTQFSAVQNSFNIQLQKRFFQCQKQRQYLSSKLQSYSKKIQTLTKQLERYHKIQKLINNTIDSQNEARREVVRLRKELQVSELKSIQQQKIWRKETIEMRQMMQELRLQLERHYQANQGQNQQ